MIKRIPRLFSAAAAHRGSILFCCLLAPGPVALVHAQTAGAAGSASSPQSSQQGGHGAAAGAHASSMEAVAPEGIAFLKLSPGSMVDVHVFEEPDIDGTYRLDAGGNINMPLGGKIPLATLTLPEAEAAIAARLISGEVLKTAHVVVNIDEYNAESTVVLGQVNTPGRLPMLSAHSLRDIIAMAGGLTPLAGNEIVVHRAGQPSDVTETIHDHRGLDDQAAMSVEINPGDSVLVKKTGVVYVLGAVLRPGGYAMQEDGDLNVAEAVAMAEGTIPTAATGKTRVLRKGPDGTLLEIATLYDKVTKGEVAPIQLHPEDIVYVPVSGVKASLGLIEAELNAAAIDTIYVVH